MRTIEHKKNGLRITDQTPPCGEDKFTKKAKNLYRELLEFVKNDPKLKLLYRKKSV